MCLRQVLADGGWGGNLFGVLESSLPVLEEEGLEDGVSSLEVFYLGGREEAHLPGQNQGLGV